MSRSAIRRWITETTFSPPRAGDAPLDCLWSKGIAQFCDVAGPANYWFDPTETVQPAGFFRTHYAGARGLVWVRLGTTARNGQPCDLDHFVREALPTIMEPFVLVTTDGDLSVPSELARETVERLLASPHLVAWATQNYVGGGDPRIRHFPIGLDLHTRRPFASPRGLLALLEKLARARAALKTQKPHVFCDLGINAHTEERRALLRELAGCPHVVMQRKRVSQAAIWRGYARHPFVLSAIGHGLDCHRTWEALMLGSIVITRTSPLDPLFAGLPVVIVDDWAEVRDPASLARWTKLHAPLARPEVLRDRLRPAEYLAPLRAALRAVEPTSA
ncbi:hypothetical protein [Kaistia nematophila]|uniref:Uncharacterized protein n=1 Tax=Kaistia nematophila TaxID=2994654 RepID=A0A9X3ILC7_9HYPH|nr:hypothetical protein [Kaistia nematophila]MCX5569717.1 hypothetical protein [Kaistia nematophila]